MKGICQSPFQHAASLLLLFWVSPVLAEEAASTRHSDADVVGYVFKITGEWQRQPDDSPLKQGERVYAGETITPSREVLAQHPPDAEIIIHLANGEREERSAKIPGSLNALIHLEPLRTPDSRFDRVMKAVQSLFVKQPERYIPTMTRGQGSESLPETVLALQNGTADLTPLFGSAPEGRYLVRLRALTASATSPTPGTNKATVDWHPGAKSGATAAVAVPGLYRVSIIDPEEGPFGETWVLFCWPENFRSAENAFRAALELTKRWGPDASDEERHAVLRAYLEHLANELRRD